MIFDFITITGADDNVEEIFLEDMATQYSHVEWGILFSTSRQGTPRYPSSEWITQLVYDFYPKWDTSFSAHICGSMCERIIRDVDLKFLEEQIGPLFTRIQLNSFPEMTIESGVSELSMNPYIYDDGGNLIDVATNVAALASAFRLDGNTEIVLPIPNERVVEVCKTSLYLTPNISFLYDSSRGKGVSPDGWPEITLFDEAYVGFAGGINPDNIKEVLDTLCARPGNRHFWLDVESGARTDDRMDIKKVEQLLKISEEFL